MSILPPAPAGILPESAVPGDFLPSNLAGGVTTAGSFGGVRCNTVYLPVVGCPLCHAQIVVGAQHRCNDVLRRAQETVGLMLAAEPEPAAVRQPAKPATPDLKVWRNTLRIYRGNHDKAAAALGIDPDRLRRMVPRV